MPSVVGEHRMADVRVHDAWLENKGTAGNVTAGVSSMKVVRRVPRLTRFELYNRRRRGLHAKRSHTADVAKGGWRDAWHFCFAAGTQPPRRRPSVRAGRHAYGFRLWSCRR